MAYYSITVVSCQLLMFHVKHLINIVSPFGRDYIKVYLYPAPPPRIINYFLTVVKHFLAFIYGQRKTREARFFFEATSVKRASEASEQGIRRKLIPPRHPILYHGV